MVTVAGAVLAVAIAVAASPLMPIGAARVAEPDPGVVVTRRCSAPASRSSPCATRCARPGGLAGGAAPARGARSARRRRAGLLPERPSRLAAALPSAGPVTSGVGVRMALEPGRGRTAVPVRSALAGTAIALTALVAAAVFGASLARLAGTPHRYGETGTRARHRLRRRLRPLLVHLAPAGPRSAGYAAGNTGQVVVDETSRPR